MKKPSLKSASVNKVIIEFSLFIFTITTLLVLVRNTLRIWLNYATLEMYSYLSITPIIIAILYVSVLKRIEVNPSLPKYVYSILLFSLGLLMIYVSIGHNLLKNIVETYNDQIMLLGTILLLHSMIVYFAKENNLFKIILLSLSILILVPPPPTWMFRFSIHLTEILLAAVIPATRSIGLNVTVKETSLYKTVSIHNGDQTLDFNLAPICSGIIGLTSVIALSPLLILIGLKGNGSLKKKLFAGVIGVLLFATLMYLVNVLRLVMIFYFSRRYGVEVGYRIFHQTPEIVLAIPITFLVIKVIDYVNGGFSINFFPRGSRKQDNMVVNSISSKNMVALVTPLVLLLSVTVPLGNLAFASTNPLRYVYSGTYEGPIRLFNVKTGEFEDYVPKTYNNIDIRYFGRLMEFEEAAGETTRIHYYRGFYSIYKTLDIYVEFADKPGDIHVWELCLPVNEINITHWSIIDVKDPVEGIVFSVREIHYSWGRINGMLIYWKDRVYSDKGLQYYRVTVMVNSYSNQIDEKDREIIYDLAEQLVLKNLQASFVKHARSTVGFSYYINTYIPLTTSLALTYSFLSLKDHYNEIFVKLEKTVKR